MRSEIARKLTASTAAGALSVLLLAAPSLAQEQTRGQRGESGASSGQIRGGGEVRGDGAMSGAGEVRGGRTERGMRTGADTRSNVRANVQGNVRTRGDVRARSDVRVRSNVNANVRTGIRGDRQAWNGDRGWRNDGWRYRDRNVRIGIGVSDPYYASGYNDGYGYGYGYDSYAAAEPYAYRGYNDGYYSYGAAPGGCTCASASYGGGYYNNAGWDDRRWGGHGWGFSAW